jgi:hypothetical protein
LLARPLMLSAMKTVRWIFLIAGIYGVLALIPVIFAELYRAPVEAPEFYYGFAFLALVFQLIFFAIARDPVGLRGLIPICILEKLAFFGPGVALYAAGRLEMSGPFVGALIDGVLMLFFTFAWFKSRNEAPA